METDTVNEDSWKTNPMPTERKRLEVDMALSPEEYQKIQLGHLPESMDDKWFIYFKDTWLNFHRSWTGNCIYRLHFEPSGNEHSVVEAWVNRNPLNYKFTDDEYERQFVRFLIDAVLLGKKSHYPRRGETGA